MKYYSQNLAVIGNLRPLLGAVDHKMIKIAVHGARSVLVKNKLGESAAPIRLHCATLLQKASFHRNCSQVVHQ